MSEGERLDGRERDRLADVAHRRRLLMRGRAWPNLVAQAPMFGQARRAEREGPGRALVGRLASRLWRPEEGGAPRRPPLPVVRGRHFGEPAGRPQAVAPEEPVQAVVRAGSAAARSAAPAVRAQAKGAPPPPAAGPEPPTETPTATSAEPPVARPSGPPETPSRQRRERPIVQRRPAANRSAMPAARGDAARMRREEQGAATLPDRPSASAEAGGQAEPAAGPTAGTPPARAAPRAPAPGPPAVGADPARPAAIASGAGRSPLPVAVVPRRVSMPGGSEGDGTQAAVPAGASPAPAHRPLVRAASRSPASLAALSRTVGNGSAAPLPVPGQPPPAPARASSSTRTAPLLGLSREIRRAPGTDGGVPPPVPPPSVPPPAPGESGVDVELLADDVYERMVRRLAAERERRAR